MPIVSATVFITLFLLDVVLLKPKYSSLVLLLGRSFDAISDPVVGFLVNKTQRRGQLKLHHSNLTKSQLSMWLIILKILNNPFAPRWIANKTYIGNYSVRIPWQTQSNRSVAKVSFDSLESKLRETFSIDSSDGLRWVMFLSNYLKLIFEIFFVIFLALDFC